MKTLKSSTKKGRTARMVTAVVLCLALMIGATYAWFSDSASTGINTITAGNLKVKLEYFDKKDLIYIDATNHKMFPEDLMDKWEPGKVVESDLFHVVNDGNLYLYYELTMDVKDEASSEKSLADVIKVAVLDEEDRSAIIGSIGVGEDDPNYEVARRNAYINYVKNTKDKKFMPISEFSNSGILAPKDDQTQNPKTTGNLFMVLYWEPQNSTALENLDNDYNGFDKDITFGLHVNATQAPHETDSFGSNYDADITFPTSQPVAG